ncbi:hypothetical protein [Heyndrickxia shackletonii]|nr:hypothetical protein [Heyndrickxia shackletonii]
MRDIIEEIRKLCEDVVNLKLGYDNEAIELAEEILKIIKTK